MARRLALLIGADDYTDPALPRMTTPAHDVSALAEVLGDPEIGDFEVRTLVNRPYYEVGAAIGRFYAECAPEDLTLLYFSGHGIRYAADGQLYLAAVDTDLANPVFTSVPAGSIDRAMSSGGSARKIVILDCCYGGAFPYGAMAAGGVGSPVPMQQLEGAGRTVLTSSSATELSFQTLDGGVRPLLQGEVTQSVFTRHLVAGLRDGSADLDGDGDISVVELYDYVYDRVVRETPKQRPQRKDTVEGGRIVIARNRNWTLPDDLADDLASDDSDDRLGAVGALKALHDRGNALVKAATVGELRGLAEDPNSAVARAAIRHLRRILPAAEVGALPGMPPPPGEAAPPREKAVPVAPAPPEQTAASPPPAPVSSPVAVPTPPAGPLSAEVLPPAPVTPPLPEQSGTAEDPFATPGAQLRSALALVRSESRSQAAVRARAAWAWLRTDALRELSRWTTVAAGLLMAAGTLVPDATDGIRYLSPDVSPVEFAVGAMAVLAIAAGGLAALRRGGSHTAPGLVVGVAAASLWGLVAFAGLSGNLHQNGVRWVHWELAGHAALAVTGAGWAVQQARDPAVRIRVRTPRGALGLASAMVAILALAIAEWALSGLLYRAREHGDGSLANAHLALAVLVVAVPACAVLLAPVRLALAVLAGFTAGEFAVGANTLAVMAAKKDSTAYEGGALDATIFMGAVLVLLGTVLLSARRAPTAPAPRRVRAATAVALGVVPLLTGTGMVRTVLAADWDHENSYVVEGLDLSTDGRTLYANASNGLLTSGIGRSREFVIDTAARKVTREVADASDVANEAVSPDDHSVYQLDADNARVVVRDLRTGTTTGHTLPASKVDGSWGGVDVSRNGLVLVLCNEKEATVYNTVARKATGVRIAYGAGSTLPTLSADGSRLYVVSGSDQAVVLGYSTTTGRQVFSARPQVDGGDVKVTALAVSPDGSQVYLGATGIGGSGGRQDAVLTVDGGSGDQDSEPIPVPGYGKGIGQLVLTPDGGRLAVMDDYRDSFDPPRGTVSVVDVPAVSLLRDTFTVDPRHGVMAVSPDASTIYVAVVHGVSAVPLSHPDRRHLIQVGAGDPRPWGP